MPKKYKVVSLGNIMGECGWEVNDAHYTGDEIELADTKIATIMRALKACGQLAKHVTRQAIYIDWESSGETSIMIRRKKNHAWLWELRDDEALRLAGEAAKKAQEEAKAKESN